MARYIDVDALLEQLNKKKSEVGKARYTDGFNDAILCVRSMISCASTADVVPKSEVAMEIFAEIEDMIKYFTVPNDCALVSLIALAELKKKYTEGATDEGAD